MAENKKQDDRAGYAHFSLLVILSSDQTQMLYMRMLFRRHDWIPASSLNYTEVGDINVALKELLDRRFIVDSMVLEFIIIIHHHLTPSKYCAFGLCL